MKRLLILLIGLLLTTNYFSQEIEYPRYDIDSLGQKVVIMTIEQAQKLDNNSELLGLFEKLNSQIESYDSICVKTINDKNIVISEQKVLIDELKNSLGTKDSAITNLQNQISRYQINEGIFNEQIENLNKQIGLKDEKIRKQKTKMIIGGSIGGISIIGLILGILIIG
jgi:chromosome segregation ATPase